MSSNKELPFVLINQNIRSLRQNFNLLLTNLQALILKPDVIVLTEIWVSEYELGSFKINGYNLFGKCNETYRSGGVAVYLRDCYQCSRVISHTDMRSADCLQLTCHIDNVELVLLAVYRLHGVAIVQYLDDLQRLIEINKGYNIIYTGDNNCDILVNDHRPHS